MKVNLYNDQILFDIDCETALPVIVLDSDQANLTCPSDSAYMSMWKRSDRKNLGRGRIPSGIVED